MQCPAPLSNPEPQNLLLNPVAHKYTPRIVSTYTNYCLRCQLSLAKAINFAISYRRRLVTALLFTGFRASCCCIDLIVLPVVVVRFDATGTEMWEGCCDECESGRTPSAVRRRSRFPALLSTQRPVLVLVGVIRTERREKNRRIHN